MVPGKEEFYETLRYFNKQLELNKVNTYCMLCMYVVGGVYAMCSMSILCSVYVVDSRVCIVYDV